MGLRNALMKFAVNRLKALQRDELQEDRFPSERSMHRNHLGHGKNKFGSTYVPVLSIATKSTWFEKI